MLDYLRKIIIIQGVGDSGKTTSIKKAMQKLAIFEAAGGELADDLIATHAYCKGRFFSSGFASGGDSDKVVRANIKFFKNLPLQLDIVVLACKSYGGSTEAALKFAKSHKIEPVIIETTKSEDFDKSADTVSDAIVRQFY